MAKGKTIRKEEIRHVRLILCGMWLTGVLVRFILALIFRHGPTVIIDESLYTNIARSLAAGEGIAYRSQPVPYLYIFYPLLLVPLYLFRLPFDLYRLTQLWNAMIMSTVVFPMFLFARDYTKDDRKALLCAGAVLLMPDMAMAGYLMSECAVWPLSLWLIFFSYRMISGKGHTLCWGILTGVFTALLFWTKPGEVAVGAAILLVTLILAVKEKDREKIKAAGAGIAVTAGMIVCFYLLYVFGFGYGMSVLGLYDKQLTEVNGRWILAVAEDSFLQMLLFAIACAGYYFVFPFVYFKEFEKTQRQFIIAFTAGLLACAIGTAALVDMYQWNESFTNMQLHLRYMAMYVPVMFVLSVNVSERKEKTKKGVLLALIIMAVLVVFPGARIGNVDGLSTSMDSMTLSAYFKTGGRVDGVTGPVLTFITAAFLGCLCLELSRRGLDRTLKRICFGFMMFFMLFNSVCGYMAGNIVFDSMSADAREANRMLEEQTEEVLGVTQRYYDDIKTYWQESQLRKPMQQVTIDNMVLELAKTGGIYQPFVPVDQAPNRGNHSTPETGTFLLGATIAEHLELNEKDVEIQKTGNGVYTLVHAEEGTRLVDSMLFGLNENKLAEGTTGTLYIFTSACFDGDQLTLTVTASGADENTTLDITSGEIKATIHLSKEMKEYTVKLQKGTPTFEAVGGDVEILTYRTHS